MSAGEDMDPSPVMTQRDLMLDLWRDMKFVRPAVESLLAANILTRIEKLEGDVAARESAANERRRLGTLTNKTLGVIVLVGNFVIAATIAITTQLAR